jgi:glycosyltransferase involved in cell wall biosynthesis
VEVAEGRTAGPPRRIGFVVEGMTGPGSGVWSRFVSLVGGLAADGVDVHALGSAHQQELLSSLPGVQAHALADQGRARRFLSRREHIESFIREAGLDAVHVESPPFPTFTGAPGIAAVHDLRGLHGPRLSGLTFETAYQQTLLGRQVRRMDAVAVLSEWSAGEVTARLRVGEDRIHVIPPIVTAPSPASTPGRQPAPRVRERPFALVLGHLEPRKNVSTIIRAASTFSWPRDLDLVIAGRDAGEGDRLRELASAARCRVDFTGTVDDDEKWRLLADASVVLLPSLIEGFGIVGVEAPLTGTPALVSDRAALPDIGGSPDAIVPALDADAWAERVAALEADAALRRSVLAGQQASAERFRPSAVIPRVQGMYRALGVR